MNWTTRQGWMAAAIGLAACQGSADNDGTTLIAGAPAGTPAIGAGMGGAARGPTVIQATDTPLPCGVAEVVNAKCNTCHGETLIGGAPMKLMTHEDWHADHVVLAISGGDTAGLKGQAMKVHEIAKLRIAETAKPMPPSGMMATASFGVLDGWLAAGAPPGTEADRACAAGQPVSGTGAAGSAPTAGSGTVAGSGATAGSGAAGSGATAGSGTAGSGTTAGTGAAGMGTAGTGSVDYEDECQRPGANDPLEPRPGETCYDFLVHGASSPTDTSKFTVPVNESYSQWYYDVPWPADTVIVRQGARWDNIQVLHHWLAFDSAYLQPAGTVEPNVTGTTLGADAGLIGGWAVGGCTINLPEGVGQVAPNPGRKIMIQWHHFNTTGRAQPDGTAVQFCTRPGSEVPNHASLTWLGTENIRVPPGQLVEEFGTCRNESNGPISIVAFIPHMHLIGVQMKTEIQRSGTQGWETVFDEPFQFDYQIHHMVDPPIVMQPGDTARATCVFQNNTAGTVAFGQSTEQEMCYQFTLSYPANALANGVLSLIGATNTCWQFGE